MFIRLGKLEDRLVGKTARGKRPVIRWPKEIASCKKTNNKDNACVVMFFVGMLCTLTSFVGAFLALTSILGDILTARPWSSGLLISGLLSITAIPLGIKLASSGLINDRYIHEDLRFCEISGFMEPLLSKDPYLTLGAAAFFTVGAMPEWLRTQMDSEGTPDWWTQRLAAEPYTVERAGLDYLELVSRIELRDETWDGSFHGKSFSSVHYLHYRLPNSLKDAVGEIILFLSSLPDSGEAPGEDTVEAVMDTIDRLATIDGESFTEAVRRLHEEEENK